MHEKKVTAEYKIADRDENILVFVDRSAGAKNNPALSSETSLAIGSWLVNKAGVDMDLLIPHGTVDVLRLQRDDFARLSPVEIGKLLDAGLVLYVLIEDYNLYAEAEGRYYNGSMVTRSILFDVAADEAVWPKSTTGEVVKVKVDLETKGAQALNARMINVTSHCIVRKFYDCKFTKFRTADEMSELDPEKW